MTDDPSKSQDTSFSLYFAGDKTFLIPDDVELMSGDLTLEDLAGAVRHVDPDAATPYEVSPEQVREHMAGVVRDTLHRADQVLAGLAALFRQMATGIAPDELPSGLGEALGVSENGPGEGPAALAEVLHGLLQTAAIAAAGERGQMEELKANARALAARWDGSERELVARALEQFPDEL
ncbi:MAG: hypothetical protein JRJ84_08490, partial [Deltaproteobacteria bacterium]|nr:hypothetical protein [Deltaproteobacteria bacterium]